jgi:AcrR family transcriptional regulator
MSRARLHNSANGFAAKRAELADRLADIALSDGLSALTLRSAAGRLGTSDRMLIYYFTCKAELVRTVLERIAVRQAEILAAPRPPVRKPADEFLIRAYSAVCNAQFMPFMRVWAEVASRGTRGEDFYRQLARDEHSRWLSWIEANIDTAGDEERRASAAAILTVLEGASMLEMSSPGCTAGVASLLRRAFEQKPSSPAVPPSQQAS